MFSKFLLIFVTIFAFTLPTYAKGAHQATVAKKVMKKHGPVDHSHVPLTFDVNYYSQLSSKNQIKYLTYLHDLVVQNALYNEKMGGKKTASLWIDFVIPASDAASKQCFSGGLAYNPPCHTLPPDLQGAAGTLTGCKADASGKTMQRCSLAFGLNTDGTALCYDKALESNATTLCDQMSKTTDSSSSNYGSISRLNQRINACLPVATGDAKCKAFLDALKNDTKSDTFVNFCSSHSGAGYCKKTQDSIASLNPYGGSGEVQTPAETNDSCNDADQKLYASTMVTSLKGIPDSKWQKLVSMSVNACGGPANLSLDAQKDKFGMCIGHLKNVEADINNDGYLQRAVSEVTNPAYGDSSSRNSPEVVKAFSNYFGITPVEYAKVFCGSQDTASFYKALNGLQDLPTPTDKFSPNQYFLNLTKDPDIASRLAAMPASSPLRNALNGIQNYQDRYISAYNAYNDAFNACSRDRASNNTSSTSCMDATTLKTKLDQADALRAPYMDRAKAVLEDDATIGNFSEWYGRTDAQKQKAYSSLKSLLGDGNFTNMTQKMVQEQRDMNTSFFADSKALDARKALQDCLKTAIDAKPDNNFNYTFTPNTQKSGGKCERQLVTDIRQGGYEGMLRVRVLGGNNAAINNVCFYTQNPVQTVKPAPRGCSIAIKGNSLRYQNQAICVDDPNKVEVYSMKCDPSQPANPGGNPYNTDR